ncbi:hypothetical protein Hdeb2414_s0001g00016521 [Helianthus debilis subsp. tardiflorus]
MNPAWGTPSTAESKYINTRLSPSWAESPTPSNKTYMRKDLATDLYGNPLPPVASHAPFQTAFVTSTYLYGNPIQVPVKPAPTTDLYGNPLPLVVSQHHRSTVAPSSLNPRNYSQTKTAFYAKTIKDASNGESPRNDDSSEHDSSSVEDVSTSVQDVTTSSSSSSKDGSECESSRKVVDSDANESTSESDSSQVRVDESKYDSCDRCDRCVGLNVKLSDLQSKYDVTNIHNQHLIVDL